MDKGLDQNAQMISETGVISVEKYEKLQNQNQELENSVGSHFFVIILFVFCLISLNFLKCLQVSKQLLLYLIFI